MLFSFDVKMRIKFWSQRCC